MQLKTFIISLILALTFTGCNIGDYHDREERIVSKIFSSQQAIHDASIHHTNSLLSESVLYAQNYDMDSTIEDDIFSLQLHVGDVTIAEHELGRFTLSNVIFDYDLDTLTDDYVYDYAGYLYDNYHDRYHFTTAIPFVGKGIQAPYKGVMQIIGDHETMVLTAVDAYHVEIAVYDHYDSYYDKVIYTTWHALGI